MAVKWKPAKDERPFFDVVITDQKSLASAIANEKIPLGAMAINVSYLKCWAHENLKDDREMYGIKFKKKGEKL